MNYIKQIYHVFPVVTAALVYTMSEIVFPPIVDYDTRLRMYQMNA